MGILNSETIKLAGASAALVHTREYGEITEEMSEKKLYELKKDPELEKMTRPLTKEESLNLEEDIKTHGCLSAIVVWNGVIVDGHNRYRICWKNHIEFEVEEITFVDKADAKMWIYRNQLARRNVSKFEKCEMVLKMEPDLKAETEERRRQLISTYRQTGETAPKMAGSADTRDIMAAIAGVSHGTLDKIRYILKLADEETKEKLRDGKIRPGTVYKKLNKTEETQETEQQPKNTETEISLSEPVEIPAMRPDPEREERPYQYVKQQVGYSVKHMLLDMQVGLYWLSNKDFSKKKELKTMIKDGCKLAIQMIDELEEIK